MGVDESYFFQRLFCRVWIAIAVVLPFLPRAAMGQDAALTPQKLNDPPGLKNVFRVHNSVFSGSSPDGDVGFASLKNLGVQTIISVDGARPEIEKAKASGIRYIHFPIGYDRVPQEVATKIAKVIRDLPGPVYIHCHHGKHRGPSATCAAIRSLEPRFDVDLANDFMNKAGTDPRYAGLFESVKSAAPVSKKTLDDTPSDFPETAEVADLVRLMVSIDDETSAIGASQKRGWEDAVSNDRKSPRRRATLLVEHFREVSRLAEKPTSVDFHDWLGKAEKAARNLEEHLATFSAEKDVTTWKAGADQAFKAVETSCKKCHDQFRGN